jgi:hypothetical protein
MRSHCLCKGRRRMMSYILRDTVKHKLHPQRFHQMSGKMAAIVGVILCEQYTTPALCAITVTSDGFVLGMRVGDCGFNEFIGGGEWTALLDAAGLSEDERAEAEVAYKLALAAGARA